jgi:hypothetical protein
MRDDRRRFIASFGTFAVAGGIGMAALRAGGYVVPREVREKLVRLRPWQFVVFEAIGARVLDPEHADVGLFADTYCAGLPVSDFEDLTGLLAYVEHVAPLAHGFGPRFSRLDPAAQDRVLAALEQSSIGLLRGGFQAVKAIAMMALYRKDASFEALGYGGPVVRWSNR